MRSTHILPLLAMVPLLGCDGAGYWFRGQAAATAYAAPLANDTTVVTTRRVLALPHGSGIDLGFGTPMPNGAGVVVTDWATGDLAVFDLADQELRRFRFNDEPYDAGVAWDPVASPDGRQIAFFWQSWAGESQAQETFFRLVDVATGESRTLLATDTAVTSHVEPIAWTPAGDSVYASLISKVNRDFEVVLIPVAGGTPRRVHSIPGDHGTGRKSLSPDGRWLLYNRERSRDQQSRSDIYIIDVESGRARPLVEHPGVDEVVGWLPGADVVLFSSDRSGTTDLWSVRVVNGRASGEPRLVRSGFFRSEAVGFADGALFYRVETGSTGPAVVNLDPQSGAPLGGASPPLASLRRVYFRSLAWSPDGQNLAAPSMVRGRRTVNLHSMATGNSQVFWADEGVYPLAVEWAADGKALFMRAGGAGPFPSGPGPQRFLHLDLITGTTQQLFAAADPAEPPPLMRFLVTPDRRSLVLRQRRTLDDGRTEVKIVLRSLENGTERELHRTSGFIPEFSLSADGMQLVFMQQVGGMDSLFIMRMDGSQPLRTVASWNSDEVTLLGWLPAGNALLGARLTEDGTREEILRIGLDGSATVVGTSPFRPQRGSRVSGFYRSRLTLSPAGNRLTHLVSDVGQELWRMDGLHELFANEASGRR